MKFIVTILLLVLIICAFLIFWNYKDENLLQIGVKTIVATSVVTIVLTGFAFASPIPIDKKVINILITRHGQFVDVNQIDLKLLEVGSKHDGYSHIDRASRAIDTDELSKNDLNHPEKLSLDTLEVAFWEWYAEKYFYHWQAKNINFHGFSNRGKQFPPLDNVTGELNKISINSIISKLKDNPYAVSLKDINSNNSKGAINLPPKIQLNIIKRDQGERVFELKNTQLTLKISIKRISSNGIWSQSLLGDYPNNSFEDHFRIEMECKYNKLRRGTEQTADQKEWIKNLMVMFYNDFDWYLVKADLEKYFLLKNGLNT